MTQERETAIKIIEILEQGSSGLNEPTLTRLAAARRQAVAAMDGRVRVAKAEVAHAGAGHFIATHLHAHGRQAWMLRLFTFAAMVLLAVLVHTNMQKNSNHEPVEADALLLASDLPPEAYVDKGFDAWLNNSAQP